MRHHTAAQRGDEGWHYVSLSRSGGYPLGYCGEHEPHETEQEARECYARYRRDRVRLDVRLGDWTGCKAPGCDKPTKGGADIEGDGFALAPLCDEHLTHEHAVAALGLDRPAGDAWIS